MVFPMFAFSEGGTTLSQTARGTILFLDGGRLVLVLLVLSQPVALSEHRLPWIRLRIILLFLTLIIQIPISLKQSDNVLFFLTTIGPSAPFPFLRHWLLHLLLFSPSLLPEYSVSLRYHLDTLLTEPIPLGYSLQPTTVSVTQVEVAPVTHQQLLLVIWCVAHVAILSELIDPVIYLILFRFLDFDAVSDFILRCVNQQPLDLLLAKRTHVGKTCPWLYTCLTEYMPTLFGLSLLTDLLQTDAAPVIRFLIRVLVVVKVWRPGIGVDQHLTETTRLEKTFQLFSCIRVLGLHYSGGMTAIVIIILLEWFVLGLAFLLHDPPSHLPGHQFATRGRTGLFVSGVFGSDLGSGELPLLAIYCFQHGRVKKGFPSLKGENNLK